MKYIIRSLDLIQCEYLYAVTHGPDDCCGSDEPGSASCKERCYWHSGDPIELDPCPDNPNYKNLLETRDTRWAIQHLQSDNQKDRLFAKTILDNL